MTNIMDMKEMNIYDSDMLLVNLLVGPSVFECLKC